MLTYPADPPPQIVCPMDEDTIPPNHFCSAPPRREPPPPLPPFSSIIPSSANYGICGRRRSGRIQGIRAQTPKKKGGTDTGAAHKPPRQNLSPSKGQRASGSMVQVSQAKRGPEEKQEDGFDFSFAAEHQNEQKDQKTPQKRTNTSPAENVVEQLADQTEQNLASTECDMDMCGRLNVGHVQSASAPMGWVIGPLFQSFRSKMASFTEIVMSPVKLLRANIPPPSMDCPDKPKEDELWAPGPADVEHSELGNVFDSEVQSEQRLSDVEDVKDTQSVAVKYSKKLAFDEELLTQSFEQEDECAVTQLEKNMFDSVPLQHTSIPCIVSEEVSESTGSIHRSSIHPQPSASVNASHESMLKISSATEDLKSKPAAQGKTLPKKCTVNRKKLSSNPEVKNKESDPEVVQLSHTNPVKSNQINSTNTDTDNSFPEPDGNCYDKIKSCHVMCHNLNHYLNDNADGRTQKLSWDNLQLESLRNAGTYSVAGLGRPKRELKLNGHSQDSVKRKRLTADFICKDHKKQEVVNMVSGGGVSRVPRPVRKELMLPDIILDRQDLLRPARKRPAVSTRANKKGKDEQEINEALHTGTEGSFDAMLVCSMDKSSGAPKDSSNNKVKASKRLKPGAHFGSSDVNIDNSMDLETTIAITSTKEAEQEQLAKVLVHPDIEQLQSTKNCKDSIKKTQKRKSPNQASSTKDSDNSAGARSAEQSEVTPTDCNAFQHIRKEEHRKIELNHPPKRPKTGFKSSASGRTDKTKQCGQKLSLKTKTDQSKEGKSKMSVDPVYFEMTPFQSQPCLLPTQPPLDYNVQLNNDSERVLDGKERDTAAVADEEFPSNHSSISVSRISLRGTNLNTCINNQRRTCRVHSRTIKGEEVTNSSKDDSDLDTAGTHASKDDLSRCLLRSYSCPEILSLCSLDRPWTSLHPTIKVHPSHQQHSSHSALAQQPRRSLCRARRHTVCSLEVEREIAPLCLRKEVYPSRRSIPYDGASLALSPSTSLSALASCFLSSPLAFLSKKADSRGASASPGTSILVSSPTSSSSSTYPSKPSTLHLPEFLQRSDSSTATLDSSSSGISLQCEIERRQQSEEEEEDGENTSSSSQEFEDVGLREEKALSDMIHEIKLVQKHEERGKVSSIRIRKTLPKPQNNLTPMGLPRPIRLKKKEFSLEEIYTNKNFSKPPESRLETIFEVPLNRRNGSESWFGQRRVKRFLEFLDVGKSRKPKKPLAGIGKAGISSSRTRRGGFPKDEPSLSAQDVDSLLCAKLDQLSLWLTHDQKDR